MTTTVEQFSSFSGRTRKVVTKEVRDATFSEIPVISMKLPEDELIEKLRYACTQVGFFYISDHDVTFGSIEELIEEASKFFNLSKDEKNEIHFSKSKHFRGYESPGDNKTEEGKQPDLNEQFNWGYDPSLDPSKSQLEIEAYHSLTKASTMAAANVWPQQVPGLEQKVKAYYGQILVLARRLAKLFAQVLHLPQDYFDKMFEIPGAMGRVLHYFPQEQMDENVLGIGAHTDIECFTILYQGNEPALQILNGEGQWVQAQPIKGTFVVNIGDMLARWSNDIFISTVHRVVNLTGKERYSIPVFIGANYDTLIKPLYTCVDESGPKYEPIKAGDYVYKRLAYSRLEKKEYEKASKALEEKN